MPKNSDTAPVTCTRCPSATGVGQALQKTKMPSEVAGIGVGVGVLLLEEEALQLGRSLEVGDHDALDGDRGAGHGRRGAVALDVVDRDVEVVVDDRALALGVGDDGVRSTLVTLTKKVSFGSGVVSPLTRTSKV